MRVLIAHGASGKAASMQGHVDGLRARGVEARAIDLPLRKAELAVPAYRERLDEQASAGPVIVSGQSYGGRVASLLAAADDQPCAGLICFSYPLHRPGKPDDWDARSQHWSRVKVPVLFLSGESDPFARIELLRRAIDERLPAARLVTYPRTGHSLKAVLDDALDHAAAFVLEIAASAEG